MLCMYIFICACKLVVSYCCNKPVSVHVYYVLAILLNRKNWNLLVPVIVLATPSLEDVNNVVQLLAFQYIYHRCPAPFTLDWY